MVQAVKVSIDFSRGQNCLLTFDTRKWVMDNSCTTHDQNGMLNDEQKVDIPSPCVSNHPFMPIWNRRISPTPKRTGRFE